MSTMEKNIGSNQNPVKAVILAGGKGTRLYPYTAFFPKPLVPLGNVPVLEIILRQLISIGITDVTLALGHLSELIKAYIVQSKYLSQQIKFNFAEEEKPTGTAGSLGNIPNLTSTFLVMNGDLLTDINYQALLDYHYTQNADLTIATYHRREKIDLGVLQLDESSQVIGYIEKPVYNYPVSMGVYVYEPRVLEHIQPNTYLDFPTLVLNLIAKGGKVCSYHWDGIWLDIGRPDDYALAQNMLEENPDTFGVLT